MSSEDKTEVPRRVRFEIFFQVQLFLKLDFRISSSDIRQDDFYIDDDIPKSDEGRDFTSGSIAELLGTNLWNLIGWECHLVGITMKTQISSVTLPINPKTENLSSDEEADFKENWDEQLELEWDDSLIDTPLSNAR